MIYTTLKQYVESLNKGLYVGVKFKGTKELYERFVKDNNIDNPVEYDDLHVTIIYSTKYDDFNIYDYTPGDDFGVSFDGYKIFKTKDGTKALVMKLDGDVFKEAHGQMMKNQDLDYSYDEYIPHMTISYDFDGDVSKLKAPKFDLEFGDFYKEDLDLDWAKSK